MNLAAILRAEHLGVKDFKTHLCQIIKTNKPHVVTEHGKPKQFLIPYEEMIEIVEILEELSDIKLLREIQSARKSYKKNKESIPLHRLWKEIGLEK